MQNRKQYTTDTQDFYHERYMEIVVNSSSARRALHWCLQLTPSLLWAFTERFCGRLLKDNSLWQMPENLFTLEWCCISWVEGCDEQMVGDVHFCEMVVQRWECWVGQ